MVTNESSPELIRNVVCQRSIKIVTGLSSLRDPEILSGTPCFYGTRVPFKNLLDYLETGEIWTRFWTISPGRSGRFRRPDHLDKNVAYQENLKGLRIAILAIVAESNKLDPYVHRFPR